MLRIIFAAALFACAATVQIAEPLGTVQAAEPYRTAVVDLGAAAKALGYEQSIVQKLQDRHKILLQRLESLKASYLEEFKQMQAEYGENGTAEQKERLAKFQSTRNTDFQSAQKKSKEELEEYRKQLIDDIRKKIAVVASEVASQRGVSVVLDSKHAAVVAFNRDSDITEDVIERLQSQAAEEPPEARLSQRKFPQVPSLQATEKQPAGELLEL